MRIKSNSRKGTKIALGTIIREVRVLTFRPLNGKLKEKFLCDLRVSSDLSGRSSQSEA